MRKLFALFLAAGLFVGTLSSCNKCQNCQTRTTVTDADGNIISDETVDGGEICNSESIDLWEAASTETTSGGFTSKVEATCE